ncbi:MAG: restriction endonuclease subunit S [Gammaproteobacteria bacterium HGW-Gammaproteobacteria-3]|jgi:type I restriction enzyme S subunit|nr:MAG: restriction endonuclease subunit S [Gammaproteobacteria bacterium HGW-Gammaproteobacteria-3]
MTEQLAEMPTYEAYKDSGVEWLGEIPEHWIVKRTKYLFTEINERSINGAEELLSVSQYTGVTKKSDKIEEGELLTNAESLEGYKKVSKDDLVSNIMLAWNGSLGFSTFAGITSPAYSVYRLVTEGCKRYFHYLLRTDLYKAEYKRRSSGVIESRLRLYTEDFFNVWSLLPPVQEQTAIAAFLDSKTAQIDQAVAIKEQQIALLKERKQILIQNAVTRGLDPNVTMRDSGVEWIGEIPAHWNLKRLKYILNERNERSKTGEEPLFMVSQTHGLVVRSEFHEKAEVAQSNVDNKIVYKNDLVFNKLKAHLGVFFKSNIDFKGLVSPDYAVYHSNGLIDDLKYFEHLFRHPAYIGQFIIRATGIVEGLIRLYTGDLFQISIPVPPKHEQKAILDHIETQSAKIDQAIAIQQQQIDKLKEYKATLINSTVTGKIRVPEVVA